MPYITKITQIYMQKGRKVLGNLKYQKNVQMDNYTQQCNKNMKNA